MIASNAPWYVLGVVDLIALTGILFMLLYCRELLAEGWHVIRCHTWRRD